MQVPTSDSRTITSLNESPSKKGREMVPLTTAVVFPVRGLNKSPSQKKGKFR